MTEDEFVETVVGLPPDGWTLGHVTINLRTGEKRVIEAMRRGAFAVHEVNTWDGREWRLSHAGAGLRIWTFHDLDDAIELAERIERMTDWAAITKMLPPGTDLYPRVRAVIDEIAYRDHS